MSRSSSCAPPRPRWPREPTPMPRAPGFDRWTGLKHAKRGGFRPNHHLFMAVLLGFHLQKVHERGSRWVCKPTTRRSWTARKPCGSRRRRWHWPSGGRCPFEPLGSWPGAAPELGLRQGGGGLQRGSAPQGLLSRSDVVLSSRGSERERNAQARSC